MSLKTTIDSLIANANAFTAQLTSLTNAVQSALGYKNAAAASAALASQVAYGDAISTKRYYINAINATLPALNIVASDFIDHAFDFDGGAWIRKCQGKSWYTEARTLGKQWGSYATATAATAAGAVVGDFYYNTTNTRYEELISGTTSSVTYRAGKAEMPMRVLATAEAARVILWDCDGTEPTMWMVFIAGASYYLGGIANVSCIALKEADICYGVSGAGNGVSRINFLSERRYYYGTGVATSGICNGLISLRNSAQQPVWGVLNLIVNAIVNSVAITILPDAPIDEYGMPVATIAAGTAGGVSVIKQDGTVVNSSSTTAAYGISFDELARVVWQYGFAYGRSPAPPLTASFSSSTTLDPVLQTSVYSTSNIPSPITLSTGTGKSARNAVASSQGLALYRVGNSSNGLIAGITSTYNTGYMLGDIRRCFLSNSQTVDRSVNAATLAVVGTPTETVNAGGRNVYSGFTNANYFQEASHADWNALGTGDFSIIMSGVKWGSGTVFTVGNGTTAGSLLCNVSAGAILFFIHNGTNFTTNYIYTAASFTDAVEHSFSVSRLSGVLYITVDGTRVAFTTVGTPGAQSISNATGFFLIGERQDASSPWTGGQCSCVRISATAPTTEQSKYIAVTENALNGGALCLLSNSSAVSALSSGAQSGLLYVGNGTNVDTFDGLKRIASEAHGVTTLQTLASGSGVRFYGGSAGGKAQAAARDINAELQASQIGLAQAQQKPVFKQISTDGAGKLTFPQGFKPTRINSTAGTYVSLATSAPVFDGFLWYITGLTASTNYDCEIVRV